MEGTCKSVISLFSSAVEQFIRSKYERKQYMSRGGSSEPSSSKQPTVKEETKAKSKPKKTASPQKPTTEQVSVAVPSNSHAEQTFLYWEFLC